MVKNSMRRHIVLFALMVGLTAAWGTGASGADLEANAFPEFYIWIGLDESWHQYYA